MDKKKMTAKVLYEKSFPKKFSKVRIELTQLEPDLVIDIREWIPALNEEGKLLPSKKGINIPVGNIDDLISALTDIKKLLNT